MIKQNDTRLRKEIQAYGCNLLAHLAMVRMDWTPEEIEIIYRQAVERRIISANCSVDRPQELLVLAGSKLRQIGSANLAPDGKIAKKPNGEPDIWAVGEDDPRVKFIIVMYSQRDNRPVPAGQEKVEHKHYTLHNPNGELYDPYDATIATYRLRKQCAQRVMTYG